MAALNSEHVLRHNRNQAAQSERPVGGRPYQNPDADPGDVCTGQVQPFAEKNPAQNQFRNDANNDGQRSLFVAFKNAVGEVAHQQDAGDKKRSDVAIIEVEFLASSYFERRALSSNRGLAGKLAHAGSLILLISPITGFSRVWTLPDGQRMTALSIWASLPRPTCKRL